MSDALNWLGGAIVGFLAAFAVFSNRVTTVERDLVAHKEQAAKDRRHDKEMLDVTLGAIRNEIAAQTRRYEELHTDATRRQGVLLEMVAGVARKMGVSHRALGVDALVNAEED